MQNDIYPGIRRAALAISYDNGGINAIRSEKQMLRELALFLERQPAEILANIDAWLSSLSDDDLNTICCGEVSEADRLLRDAPVFTDGLLNDFFNEVC
jgi:hypothetical protein